MPSTPHQSRTLAHLFGEAVRRYRHRVCSYHSTGSLGQWKALTWADWHDEVCAVTAALLDAGVERQERVGILSATRREWLTIDLAIMSAAATTVGIYDTHTADQCAYILKHAGIRVLFLEDRDQLHKVRSIWPQLPELDRVILLEPAPDLEGTRVYSYADFLARGKALVSEEEDFYGSRLAAVDSDMLAALAYTSGTTGPPKGVMLSHRCVMATIASVQRALPMNDSDVTIVNLSLAHSLQRIGAWNAIANGSTQVFGDRLDRFSSHLTQFNPTVQLSVPRMFEKFYGAIHEDLLGQDLRRRKMFEWALDVARQVKQCEREGRRPPRHMRLQLVAAERTVLGPLRERFGGRIRFFISGAAPLSAEIIEFFEALGMPVYEGYGLTETCAPATVNTPSDHKLNTVGKPLDICELRVERDGEILIRGENVTSGYYRDEASTEEAFDADGWFKTGDLGVIDQDGFLRITGRKKDLIITAGGKNVSPANVETAFEREALIKHCVVFGDRQKYLVALFDLDTEALARFVERFDLHDLTEEQQRTHPQVVAEVQLITDRVNRTLARFETVKYFSVVPESLSVEDGFLTPTLKVKRQRVFDRYETEIMNLYETRRKRQESLW